MKNLIYIFFLISFFSCNPFRKVVKKKTSETTKVKSVVARFDNMIKTEKNRAIYDKFIIKVPKSSTNDKSKDSIIDARLDEILAKINFRKQSGSNSYKIKYNPENREIQTDLTIGETLDKSSISHEEKTTDTSVISKFDNYIKKTGIPIIYIIMFAIYFFRHQIFWLLKIVYPPIASIKIVKLLNFK